jgi:hypothetical protein
MRNFRSIFLKTSQALGCMINLLIVQMMLATFGAHRTGRILLANVNAAGDTSFDAQAIARWRERASRLRGVSRYVPGTQCLARSITLVWWARRTGAPARLFVGVKHGHSGIEGHAWSDLHGVILDELPEIADTFTLTAFPGASMRQSCAPAIRPHPLDSSVNV